MLLIEWVNGFLASLFQRFESEDFNIQAVGVSGRISVAKIIHVCSFKAANNFINQLRVNQRAITSNTHHYIGLVFFGGLHIAIQHIVFAALFASVAKLMDMLNQGQVAFIDRCGHDDLIYFFGTRQAGKQQLNNGNAAYGFHHLVRQAGRTHAGLDDGRNFHTVDQFAGLIRFSSSHCKSGNFFMG